MVLDTSAILAILQNEPERRKFNEAIETAETRSLSTASFVECSMILESRYGADGVRDLDLSLSKEFKIREDMKLQIRAEMYNVTNTPRFAFPDSGWARDSGFGTVQNTTNNFRRMQFGARFQF